MIEISLCRFSFLLLISLDVPKAYQQFLKRIKNRCTFCWKVGSVNIPYPGSIFCSWARCRLHVFLTRLGNLVVNLQEKMNGTFETMVRQHTEIQHCELFYLQISQILFVGDPVPFRQMYQMGHIEFTNKVERRRLVSNELQKTTNTKCFHNFQ